MIGLRLVRDNDRDEQPPTGPIVTFGEYSESWLLMRRGLAERTTELYGWLLRRHICTRFGDFDIQRIGTSDVRIWNAELAGTRPTTAAKAYRLFSLIMRSALDDELIDRSPCRIKGACAERPPERPTASIAEVESMVRAMPPRLRVSVLLAAWCQLRRGEVRGVRRRDVDMAEKRLTVCLTQVTSMAGKNIVKAPKSKAGRRTISIPSHVMGAVADHLDVYVDDSPDAFLITTSNQCLSAAWNEARASVGRSDLRFHDLRHSGLTWAATAGATVSELMNRAGHATMESSIRYQHATADRDRHIADSLSELARISSEGTSRT